MPNQAEKTAERGRNRVDTFLKKFGVSDREIANVIASDFDETNLIKWRRENAIPPRHFPAFANAAAVRDIEWTPSLYLRVFWPKTPKRICNPLNGLVAA